MKRIQYYIAFASLLSIFRFCIVQLSLIRVCFANLEEKKDVRLKTAPYALLSWRCQVLQFSPAPLYVVSLYFVSRLMNKSHFLKVMRVCSNKRFKQWKDSFPHSTTVPFAPLDRSIDRSYVSSMQLNDIVKHFSSLITKTIIVFRLSPFLPTQSLKLF